MSSITNEFKIFGFKNDLVEGQANFINEEMVYLRKTKSDDDKWLESGKIIKISAVDHKKGKSIYRKLVLAHGKMKSDEIGLSYQSKKKLIGERPSVKNVNIIISSVNFLLLPLYYFQNPNQDTRFAAYSIVIGIVSIILTLSNDILW
ncbi:MAG: hypothetical protein H8E98_00185 [Bacteroidetes bacterium]|nr:hypothetical protein [Bacteroidota bacterium]